MYMYICIYIYIYIYIHNNIPLSLALSLSLYIYIYIYTHICSFSQRGFPISERLRVESLEDAASNACGLPPLSDETRPRVNNPHPRSWLEDPLRSGGFLVSFAVCGHRAMRRCFPPLLPAVRCRVARAQSRAKRQTFMKLISNPVFFFLLLYYSFFIFLLCLLFLSVSF